MVRFTEEQVAAHQALLAERKAKRHGHPLKDALVSEDTDAFRFQQRDVASNGGQSGTDDAVGAGQEIALHREIMKECRRRGWVYVYHDPTRKTGATLGCPDFIIYCAGGTMLHVECKTVKGTLSKAQKQFRDDIMKLGHEYRVIRSITAFKRLAEADYYNNKGV